MNRQLDELLSKLDNTLEQARAIKCEIYEYLEETYGADRFDFAERINDDECFVSNLDWDKTHEMFKEIKP